MAELVLTHIGEIFENFYITGIVFSNGPEQKSPPTFQVFVTDVTRDIGIKRASKISCPFHFGILHCPREIGYLPVPDNTLVVTLVTLKCLFTACIL